MQILSTFFKFLGKRAEAQASHAAAVPAAKVAPALAPKIAPDLLKLTRQAPAISTGAAAAAVAETRAKLVERLLINVPAYRYHPKPHLMRAELAPWLDKLAALSPHDKAAVDLSRGLQLAFNKLGGQPRWAVEKYETEALWTAVSHAFEKRADERALVEMALKVAKTYEGQPELAQAASGAALGGLTYQKAYPQTAARAKQLSVGSYTVPVEAKAAYYREALESLLAALP